MSEPQPTPTATMASLLALAKRTETNGRHISETITSHPDLFAFLEREATVPNFSLESDWIYLRFAGDGPKFATVWRALRAAGFEPAERPKPGVKASQFSCFFHKRGQSSIFLSFSSTVCKTVQTGTKTIEVPQYEIQCEEDLSTAALDTEAVPALDSF